MSTPVTAPQLAISLLKQFEGLRLEAYMDVEGNPTIGYGHKLPHGSGLNLITEAQATALLQTDADSVAQLIARVCKVPLNVNQQSALISFVYNVGAGNFSTSTLLKRLNTRDYIGASQQFAVWNKVAINGKLQVSAGLVNRRQAEKHLYLTPVEVATDAQKPAQPSAASAAKPQST